MSFECPNCGIQLIVSQGSKAVDSRPSPAARAMASYGGSKRDRPAPPASELGALLDRINDGVMMGFRLDGKDERFYSETVARFAQYQDRIRMSPAQMGWIEDIAIKSEAD